jgi:hypothetical protein
MCRADFFKSEAKEIFESTIEFNIIFTLIRGSWWLSRELVA